VALIYLSLGSNIDRTLRICAALDALAENFGDLTLSSVYESDSVGFKGDNFYNLVWQSNPKCLLGKSPLFLRR
jgi:2-amino-4-hydroxy-6-hydroxymethyldihydropteridine diphosphokinase